MCNVHHPRCHLTTGTCVDCGIGDCDMLDYPWLPCIPWTRAMLAITKLLRWVS